MIKKKIRNKAEAGRIKRHYRIRKRVLGTSDKPRLCVHRSHKNLYVQFIDDVGGKTILSLSTADKAFREESKKGGNIEAAKKMGQYASVLAKKKGIEKAVFDRGGYLFHGRIKAFADALKETGLKF